MSSIPSWILSRVAPDQPYRSGHGRTSSLEFPVLPVAAIQNQNTSPSIRQRITVSTDPRSKSRSSMSLPYLVRRHQDREGDFSLKPCRGFWRCCDMRTARKMAFADTLGAIMWLIDRLISAQCRPRLQVAFHSFEQFRGRTEQSGGRPAHNACGLVFMYDHVSPESLIVQSRQEDLSASVKVRRSRRNE